MSTSNDASKHARKTDQATKTVAAVLQEFGRQAFDVSDRSQSVLRTMCDRWVAHLLFGEPSPSRADLPENWLDWPGVRDFIAAERERERRYVLQNVSEYQDLAVSLMKDFSASLEVEQECDGQLRERLEGLHTQAKESPAEELRTEVFSTIENINLDLEEKRSRQDAQLAELATQVSDLELELSRVRESAERDALSGLYNRRAFDAQIQQLIGRCSEVGLSAVLMKVDIDHFKALNDSCGHVFGDEVIRGVASCMARSLDQDGDFVARYGGEEFAIVISGRLSDGIQRGEALLEQIRSLQFFREGEGHSVTVSVGVSAIRMGEDASSWIDRSDRALYLSKQMGRNRLTAES